MENTFETPLINKLRKAGRSPLTLIIAVFCLIISACALLYFVPNYIKHSVIDYGAALTAVCFAVTGGAFIAVFASAGNTDRPLGSAGYTVAAIASAAFAVGAAAIGYFHFSAFFVEVSSSLCMAFGKILIKYGLGRAKTEYFELLLFTLPFFSAFAAYLSLGSSVRNNRPRTFFPILFAVVCFLHSAVAVANFTLSTLQSRHSFGKILMSFVNQYPLLVMEIINIASGILFGIFALKLACAAKKRG